MKDSIFALIIIAAVLGVLAIALFAPGCGDKADPYAGKVVGIVEPADQPTAAVIVGPSYECISPGGSFIDYYGPAVTPIVNPVRIGIRIDGSTFFVNIAESDYERIIIGRPDHWKALIDYDEAKK